MCELACIRAPNVCELACIRAPIARVKFLPPVYQVTVIKA